MATKQLSYNTNAIDDRLGKAHSHSNLESLNLLTTADFENIKSIKNKLDVDMTNADLVALASAVKKSGVAFIDAESNGYTFARKDGEWVDITSALNPVIGKGDSNVTVTNEITDTSNVITVTLSAEVIKKLNSIATKLDAIVNPVADDIVAVKSDGTLQDSGIRKDDIILKSSLENSYLSQSKNTAPSSYALYQVYTMAIGISGGVGQVRGTVYNAFTSSNCATIDVTRSISVVDSGENYAEGSIVYSSLGSIPAVFKIIEVESGSNGIKTLEVIDSGNFDINSSSDKIFFSVYGNVGSGAQIECYLDNSAVYSTLDTIKNPVNSDLAIVLSDEYHNSASSIYMYMSIEDSNDSFNGWIWLASFSDANRDFISNPINTEEIEDNAITSDKLYKIPEKSLLANNSDISDSPTSMTFAELAYALGLSEEVTGVKGSAESEYRKGNVEISLENISGAIGFDNITVNPQYISKTVDSDTNQLKLDLTDEVKSLISGDLGDGLMTINSAGTSDYGDGIKYPRSITPPLNSSDATIATTEFVRNKIMENNMSQTGTTSTYPYLSSGYYQILLSPGTYKLECWGAQGGCAENQSAYGGKGGYASIQITVSGAAVMVYAVVGSHPVDSNGGFNGGGNGGFYYGKGGKCTGYGGGGATHIALVPGLLADLAGYNIVDSGTGQVSNPQVLLVAGGGGGAYGATATSSNPPDVSTPYTVWASGGYGGGDVGGNGFGSSASGGGYGGTSTAGGATITEAQMNNGQYNPTPGSFGKGGNGNSTTKSGYSANNGGAGGGGWFGGGGSSPIYPSHNGYHTGSCYHAGGGGSGYTGIVYANTYIRYVEDTATLIAGSSIMPDSSGSSTQVTGNSGNGKVKITYYG